MSNSTSRLSMLAPGEQTQLIQICGGHTLRRRLLDLGLNIGTQECVAQGDAAVPLILASRHDARLALGQGVTRRSSVKMCHTEKP